MTPTPTPTHLNVMFSPDYAVPVFGYVVPPLAVLVLIVNSLMIWTLSRPHMRSPLNSLLTCIAISDTLAIMFPVAPFIYFYTLGYYMDFVPFAWCRAFFIFVHVLPLLANMASLWSTVALAYFRFYSVVRPLRARSVITSRGTNMTILGIYIVCVLVYSPLIFEYSYTRVTAPSMIETNSTILTCHMQKSTTHHAQAFCKTHTWLQIIFTSLLPWFLITFPDFGLLWKLRQADNDRKHLQNGGKAIYASENSPMDKQPSTSLTMAARKRMTSWMIFIIVSMVWMVEIPFAASFTTYLAHNNGDVMRNNLGKNVIVVLLLKYVTYPLVFLLYCFMSQNFRQAFVDIILCREKTRTSSSSGSAGNRPRLRSNTTSDDQDF